MVLNFFSYRYFIATAMDCVKVRINGDHMQKLNMSYKGIWWVSVVKGNDNFGFCESGSNSKKIELESDGDDGEKR